MSALSEKKILVPGTVLLDIYENSGKCFLGGAEFNFAFHIHHLYGSVDFLSRVGKDNIGTFILEELGKKNFPTNYIQQDPIKPTKTVKITKDENNEPLYCIASNVASEHLEQPDISVEQLKCYKLIYFGTTLQYGLKSRETVRWLLQQCEGIKFCDINLRPDKYTKDTIDFSLSTCNFLKINHEELDCIASLWKLEGSEEELVMHLANYFSIEGICLTLAEKGSMLYLQGEFYYKKLYSEHVVDTVGAGDAFSAYLAIGLLEKWNPRYMLDKASSFAAAICQNHGAIPDNAGLYDDFK